jgi:hypothetical protein
VNDYTPRPGDLYLTAFGGLTGAGIRLGQLLTGDASRYTHAGVVLDRGEVLSAQPAGARVDPVGSILKDRPLAFLPVPDWAQDRRDLIVASARSFEGHTYGFASYLWLALARVGVRPEWLRRVVASDRTLICSALADRVWSLAGIALFDDGRMWGEVTPGDLAHAGVTVHIGTGPWDTFPPSDPQ